MVISKDLINPAPIDPLFGEKITQSSKAIADIQGMDFNYKPPEYSQGQIALSAFEREKMGNAARERVKEKFTKKIVIDAYLHHITDILKLK